MIYRTDDAARWGIGKGANLLPVEVDGNFWELASRLVAVETNPAQPAEISNIQVAASQMTVFLSDGRTLGPYTLPTAMIRYRGDWTAASSYQELDLVLVPNDGVYLVLRPHVAGQVFDPGAVGAQGAPLYRWLFPSRTATMGEAPSDGLLYGRLNAAWVEVPAAPTWDTLAGKPATFPPSAHAHDWADVTGKPATFPPSGHNHPWGEVTGKPATVDALPAALGAVGQVIKVNSTGTGLLWAADETEGPGAGGATNLDGLSDVVIAAPATGQVLKFDGTTWVNAADEAGGGGGATTIDALTDVAVVTPVVAQVLRHNGTEWVNAVLGWADLGGKPATFPPTAHAHLWADISDPPASYPPSAHSHDWASITAKPATFAPSAHTHPWADVTGKPATVAALPAAVGAEGQVLKAGAGGTVVWGADNTGTGGGGTTAGPQPGDQVGSHKYWRMEAYASYGAPVSGYAFSVFTLEFRFNGVENTKTGGASFGNVSNHTSAFDGSNTSQATAVAYPADGSPLLLGYQFANPVAVDTIRVGTYYPSVWGPATPALYDISYSDDGITYTKLVRIDERGKAVPEYNVLPIPTEVGQPLFYEKTASYTLVNSDLMRGTNLEMNVGTANTVTVPPGLTRKSAVSIIQLGAGQTSIVAGAGVTIRAPHGLRLEKQFARATLIPRGNDVYYLRGNLIV